MRLHSIFTIFSLLAMGDVAFAGPHTSVSWSSEPRGNGVAISTLSPGGVAYYNFNTATDSRCIATMCHQIFTRVEEVTTDIVIDIQACETTGAMTATDLVNGSNISASTDSVAPAPEGGVAAGIKVNVDTCTTCEGEVEVVCGGR